MIVGGHINEAEDLHGQPSHQWHEGQMSDLRRLQCSHKTLIRWKDRDGRITGLLVSLAEPVLSMLVQLEAGMLVSNGD